MNADMTRVTALRLDYTHECLLTHTKGEDLIHKGQRSLVDNPFVSIAR
jgi:hypothetical protein